MTKVVAINGTNIWPLKYGRLEHFFDKDEGVIFPYRPVWLEWDFARVIDYINRFVGRKESYHLIGFSSGATIAHLIAAFDRRVRFLVAVSGLSPRDPFPIRPELQVLLTSNEGEHMSMIEAMSSLFETYRRGRVEDVSMETISHDQWPSHRFGPAIPTIQRWAKYRNGEGFPFAISQ